MSDNYDFERYIKRLKRRDEQLSGHCPFHKDHTPSFSANKKTGLWKCHTGCGEGNYRDFIEKIEGSESPFKIVAQYIYWDHDERPILKVNRKENGRGSKKFFQEHFENGKWVVGGSNKQFSPYEYHKWRDSKEAIYFVEGEKCVKSLEQIGLKGTTIPGGANAWKPTFAKYFEGRDIILLPDNDKPGEKFAEVIFNDLAPVVKSIKVVRLPHLKDKGDVCDYLAGEGGRDDLLSICKKTQTTSEFPKIPDSITQQESEDESEYYADDWEFELNPKAYHGIAGEFIRRIEKDIEPDPIAVLSQVLACYGNIIGKKAHFKVQSAEHYANLFMVLVGNTAKARKGTSFKVSSTIFKELYPEWFTKNMVSGLSSGEGLISPIRDPDEQESQRDSELPPVVSDKRLFVKQEEFGATLQVLGRQGNILSAMLRDAWDSESLCCLTKNPLKSTGAHISIVGHITKDELLKCLTDSEATNGFGNRFIWLCVKRRRYIPWGSELQLSEHEDLLEKFRDAVSFGTEVGLVDIDPEAKEMWGHVYKKLSKGTPGLFGNMIARSEAQVLRLALIYALLDLSPLVGVEHLTAALALWEYSENSAHHIFGDYVGETLADEILRHLRSNPQGLTRTDFHHLFNRNKQSQDIMQALVQLRIFNVVKSEKVMINGRGREVWKALKKHKTHSKYL